MNAPGLSLLTARGELSITPAGLATWAARLCSWDGTAPRAAATDRNWLGDSFPQCYFVDNVAVMEVFGPLVLRPNYIERNLGALGYDTISEWLDTAIAKGAKGILLFIASPGGSVTGMIETAERVADVATKIPTAVFTDELNASAAFGLSAGAGKVYCTKSAVIGSIGTRLTILDASAFYASLGLKFHSFASGKFKSAGDETQPMSADWARYFDGMVQSSADEFKNFVSQFRSIDPDLMDGRIMRGSEAVTNGFADEIVPSLEAAVERVLNGQVPLQKRQGRNGSYSGGGLQSTSGRIGARGNKSQSELKAEAFADAAEAQGRVKIFKRQPYQSYSMADYKAGKLK